MRRFSWTCLLLLAACPPSLRRPESPQVVLTGTVYAGGFERRGEPLTTAKLKVLRAETGEELAGNPASSAGGYRFSFTVTPGTRVVLVAEAEGFAPFSKAFVVGPYTELTSAFTLEPLSPLECLDTGCLAPHADVAWLEPPPGAAGAVTHVEPDWGSPVQVDVDETRPVLLALGYAQLSEVQGTLSLRVPPRQWPGLVDARPGTGVVEVPVALFDPARGRWSTRAPVVLRSEGGLPIPEEHLAQLRSGLSESGARVELPATSGQFFAVLGPRAEEGCLRGSFLVEGTPAQGVSVTFADLEPVSSGASGEFCVSAPSIGSARATPLQYAGLPYRLPSISRPTSVATCGGACTSVGALELRAAVLETAATCKLKGRVVDVQGVPVAGAEVVGFDESVTGNTLTSFCGATGTRCALVAPSGADGSFSLGVPQRGPLLLTARFTGPLGGAEVQLRGGGRFEACADAPVELKLDRGERRLDVGATFQGEVLAWMPPLPASRVTVLDGTTGLPKWEVTSALGLSPPLTYGQAVSSPAQVTGPTGGAASGDQLVIDLAGVGADGLVYLGSGSAMRP
jgi:hypothetical protein